jgi:hypothetical protein
MTQIPNLPNTDAANHRESEAVLLPFSFSFSPSFSSLTYSAEVKWGTPRKKVSLSTRWATVNRAFGAGLTQLKFQEIIRGHIPLDI